MAACMSRKHAFLGSGLRWVRSGYRLRYLLQTDNGDLANPARRPTHSPCLLQAVAREIEGVGVDVQAFWKVNTCRILLGTTIVLPKAKHCVQWEAMGPGTRAFAPSCFIVKSQNSCRKNALTCSRGMAQGRKFDLSL